MKKLILVPLLLSSYFGNAQWSCNNTITFDRGDSLYPIIITIDTIHYHHNIWQIGAPHKTVFSSAFSSPNAIVTDTLNHFPVNDTSVFVMGIPKRAPLLTFMPPFYELQFYYQLNIDTGTIAKVDISIDNGLHWSNVSDSLPPFFYWISDTAKFLTSTTGWTSFRMHGCMACSGDSSIILFRFTFISDSVPALRDGWIIDNINISYWCEGYVSQLQTSKSISIFPNPTSSYLTVTSTNEISQIAISNLLGQTLFTHDYNSEKVEVDVADLPKGVYLIKINGTEVRKFVKE